MSADDQYTVPRIDRLAAVLRAKGIDLYQEIATASQARKEAWHQANADVQALASSTNLVSQEYFLEHQKLLLDAFGDIALTMTPEDVARSYAEIATAVAMSDPKIIPLVFRDTPFLRAVTGSTAMWKRSSAGQGYGRQYQQAEAFSFLELSAYGYQRFHVSSVLAEELAGTKFRSPLRHLRLPYPSYSVALPRATAAKFPVRNRDGTAYPLSEAWVLQHYTKRDGGVTPVVAFWCYGDSGRVGAPHDENVSVYHVPFLTVERLRQKYVDESVLREATTDWVDKDMELRLLRVLCNTILYINSVGADCVVRPSDYTRLQQEMSRSPKPSQRQRRDAALAVATRTTITKLGSRLRRHHDATEPGTGPRLQHEHWVRGHWRFQRVGPGRAERRPTWVRHHRRGVGLPPLLRSSYSIYDEPIEPTPVGSTAKETP